MDKRRDRWGQAKRPTASGLVAADTFPNLVGPTCYGLQSVSNIDHVALPASLLDKVQTRTTSKGSMRRVRTKRLCDHCPMELHVRHEVRIKPRDDSDVQLDRDLLMNALRRWEGVHKFHDALRQEMGKHSGEHWEPLFLEVAPDGSWRHIVQEVRAATVQAFPRNTRGGAEVWTGSRPGGRPLCPGLLGVGACDSTLPSAPTHTTSCTTSATGRGDLRQLEGAAGLLEGAPTASPARHDWAGDQAAAILEAGPPEAQ